MINKKFAICLAAYNGIEFIEQQIKSILDQSEVDVIIYINVDKSNDGTEEFVYLWSLREPRLKLMPFGNRFGGAALNFFNIIYEVDFRDFDYVCFSDQDDIWLPDKLSRSQNILNETDSDGYSSNVTAFWDDGRKLYIKKSQNQVEWDFLFEAAGPGCSYVFKRDLIFAIQSLVKSEWNRIHEIELHDWFFYAYARANGYKWIIDDYSSLLYRQHELNQVGVNVGWRAMSRRAKKLLKGKGLVQSRLIADLVGLADNVFVKKWSSMSRFGMFFLGVSAWKCRRRVRDKLFFLLYCMIAIIVGVN